MGLLEVAFDKFRVYEALKKVVGNHGAAGVDGMPADEEAKQWVAGHLDEIVSSVLDGSYRPLPARRVYIPKANGKKRPLGIPTVVDRTVQQAMATALSGVYDRHFSPHSHGFRPGRSCATAMEEALGYLNEGYTWIVDLDIEKFFDTVNHDRLISIVRERVNESGTLRLIRSFLRAGVMDDGLVKATDMGTPQGAPVSPVLSNIYLDQLDKELESRGLRFVRYADDCNIFVGSKEAAERVMRSITGWLERKLFLKVSAEKTKVVPPNKGQFLGFTYWKDGTTKEWKCRPQESRKQRLKDKVKEVTIRRRAVAVPLGVTFKKLNLIVKGWINYYSIGSMKRFLQEEFGPWLRHKVRVVIVKQWKYPPTIYRNLSKLNRMFKGNFTDEVLYATANARLGWYRKSRLQAVNYLLSPAVLAIPKVEGKGKDAKVVREGLVNPLDYYLTILSKKEKEPKGSRKVSTM